MPHRDRRAGGIAVGSAVHGDENFLGILENADEFIEIGFEMRESIEHGEYRGKVVSILAFAAKTAAAL